MKYILSFIGILVVCLGIFFCQDKEVKNDDYMRIHITANSNNERDQNLKYLVKDAVVEYLIPNLADAKNKTEAEAIISTHLSILRDLVNQTLQSEHAGYSCSINIAQENMPTRAYGDFILESGEYDSLSIVLGEGKGDNWWCVVFPAVCFVSSKNFENLVYISKIWEIINNVTN